jgi:hypothetical protein
MQKQIEEDEQRAREYDALVAKEQKIREDRRMAAIETAKGFRQQRDEKEELKQRLRNEQIEDEAVLANQLQREFDAEKAATIRQKTLARELRERNMRENQAMIAFKERSEEIEQAEERRINELAVAMMDEEDRRKAVDAERHRAKLLAREKLIDAERKRQEATRTIQEDFLDKQLREQHEKEQAAIATNAARTEKLAQGGGKISWILSH